MCILFQRYVYTQKQSILQRLDRRAVLVGDFHAVTFDRDRVMDTLHLVAEILVVTAAGGLAHRDVQRALALDLGGAAHLGDGLLGGAGRRAGNVTAAEVQLALLHALDVDDGNESKRTMIRHLFFFLLFFL